MKQQRKSSHTSRTLPQTKRDASLARALVTWFEAHRRPMPWRLKVTPYVCWLSEIMMQQTTYEQALPFFRRFLARFPTVERLASAGEPAVLKAWEGLGYYARARHLREAAIRIVAHGWPHGYAAWLVLPGVGPYTAAALASVLDGERVCVVDGNVARVFARYWHLPDNFKEQAPRARLAERLRDFMDDTLRPGDFNQAMMELGALVCTPTAPACGDCPLAATCAARAAHDADDYPKNGRRGPVPVRRRTFVVIRDGTGKVLLVRHAEGGLLRGLWDLPTIEQTDKPYAQTFSHFKLEADVWQGAAGSAAPQFRDPKRVPLTTAARRILNLSSPVRPRVPRDRAKSLVQP